METEGRSGEGMKKQHLLFLILLSLLLYLPSLFGQFVFDDHYLLEQNAPMHTKAGIREAFTEDYYGQSNPRYALGYYRPLALLSHWIDGQIWNAAPFGHHLTNVVLHVLVVAILYLLIAALFQDRSLAFLASCIFAVHPAHAASVTFISGRVDALAAMFSLLSLL